MGDQIDKEKLREVIKTDIKQRIEELENTSGGGISNIIEHAIRRDLDINEFVENTADYIANSIACSTFINKWEGMKKSGNIIINTLEGLKK